MATSELENAPDIETYKGQIPENGMFSAIRQAIEHGELTQVELQQLPHLLEDLTLPNTPDIRDSINWWLNSEPKISRLLTVANNTLSWIQLDLDSIKDQDLPFVYKVFRKIISTPFTENMISFANYLNNGNTIFPMDNFIAATSRYAADIDLYQRIREKNGIASGNKILPSQESKFTIDPKYSATMGESLWLTDINGNFLTFNLNYLEKNLGTFAIAIWKLAHRDGTASLHIEQIQKRIGNTFDYSQNRFFLDNYNRAFDPELEQSQLFSEGSRNLSIRNNKFTLFALALLTKRLLDLNALEPNSDIRIPYFEDIADSIDNKAISKFCIPLPIETIKKQYLVLTEGGEIDTNDNEELTEEFYSILLTYSRNIFLSSQFDIDKLNDPYPYDSTIPDFNPQLSLQKYKELMNNIINTEFPTLKVDGNQISTYEYLDKLTNYSLTKEILKLKKSGLNSRQIFTKALSNLTKRTKFIQTRYADYPSRSGNLGMFSNCGELIQSGLIRFERDGMIITNAKAFADIIRNKLQPIQAEEIPQSQRQLYSIEELILIEGKFNEMIQQRDGTECDYANFIYTQYQSLIHKIVQNREFKPREDDLKELMHMYQNASRFAKSARNAFLLTAVKLHDAASNYNFEEILKHAKGFARINGFNMIDRSNANETIKAAQCIDKPLVDGIMKFNANNTYLLLNNINIHYLIKLLGSAGYNNHNIGVARELLNSTSINSVISPNELAEQYFDTPECKNCTIQRCQIREHKLEKGAKAIKDFMVLKNFLDAVVIPIR
jgi:hypothetical protein